MEADVFVNNLVKASAEGFFDLKGYRRNTRTESLRAVAAIRQYKNLVHQRVCFVNFLSSLFGYLASIINLRSDTQEQHKQEVADLNKDYKLLFNAMTGITGKKDGKEDSDPRITSKIQEGIDLYKLLFMKQNK